MQQTSNLRDSERHLGRSATAANEEPSPAAGGTFVDPTGNGATRRWIAGMMVVLLLAWPLVRWLVRPTDNPLPAAAPGSVVTNSPATTAALLELAAGHFRGGRYQDCVEASKRALILQPDAAEAFNTMGACYGAMGNYDDEIVNVQQALRLQPDSQLARNNLAWALARKNNPAR